MRSIALIAFAAVFLFSCASLHDGMMTANPNYVSDEYSITSIAIGTARAHRVLGIGGFNKDALILEARKNMYAAFPLKKGQSYANISVDWKRTFALIYDETAVTVSADIIERTPGVEKGELQPIFQESGLIPDDLIKSIGDNQLQDTVSTFEGGKIKKYVLLHINDDSFFTIRPTDGSPTEIKVVNRSELFFPNPIEETPIGFSVGREYVYSGSKKVWILEAVGETQALLSRVENGEKTYRRSSYQSLRSYSK